MISRPPRETPGFQQIALGVIEQDVGLPVLGEAGVSERLSHVPFEWAFALTARVDAEVRHGHIRRRGDAAQLEAAGWAFNGHPRKSELLELVAREGRVLFNTPYLHALQRLLVLKAADGFEEAPDGLRRLQDGFLGMCNVVSPASKRPANFDRDHYVALLTRSGVVNATETIAEAITRAYAIYYELPRRPDASAAPNYCPPAQWEPDVRRTISVHERFMIGMAILGNVGVLGEDLPPRERPTGVPPGYFDRLAEELRGGDAGRLVGATAGDRAFFRRMFEREKPGPRGNPANSIPFQVRPLLSMARGGYLLSSTNALVAWITRGVHYACLTPIEGTPAAEAFLTYVGRLFEAYAVELLQDAHGAQPEVRVIGEQPYDGGSMTSDVAIVDGNDLVLIEIEAHRFTKDALLSADAEQVLRELDRMIVSKARQLDRCIDALRRPESPAELPGVDIRDIERIWPVVVIEGGIVQNALLWEHIEAELGGALGQDSVQRLSVMTMNELEATAGFFERGHRVAMLLHRWKFGSGKYADFTHYCSMTPGLERPRRAKLVERRWERLTEEVEGAFSEEARARLRAT